MTVSETKVTALPDIYRKAAEELGYQLVDVNGESQIGISFSRKNEKKLARSFNFTFHNIYDVLSLYNSAFGDFVDCI